MSKGSKKSKIHLLGVDYQFDLIPSGKASKSAGYTEENRKNVRLGAEPVVDGSNFYYCAWYQDPETAIPLNCVLVCRRIEDGALIYARPCGSFNLDSDPNIFGYRRVICSNKIAICQNRIYLVNSAISNIGPQIYCVDKHSGDIIWAAAYATPTDDIINSTDSYADLYNGHLLYCNCDPRVFRAKNRTFIAVGVSSMQEEYPLSSEAELSYSDLGAFYLLEDCGKTCRIEWKVDLAPPPFVAGMTLEKSKDSYDVFGKKKYYLAFSQTQEDYSFCKPYFFDLPPYPGKDDTTPIIKILRPGETLPLQFDGLELYLDSDRVQVHNYDSILEKCLDTEEGDLHVVWTYVDAIELEQLENVKELIYLRQYEVGDIVNTDFEARCLNYYGNNVEGDCITVDPEHNMVYFASSYSHQVPFDDCMTFDDAFNYYDVFSGLINASRRTAEGHMEEKTYRKLNERFAQSWTRICKNWKLSSPRARRNFASSIVGVSIMHSRKDDVQAGEIQFVSRFAPWDSVSFCSDSRIAKIFSFRNLATTIRTPLYTYKDRTLIAFTSSGFLCKAYLNTVLTGKFDPDGKTPSNIFYSLTKLAPTSGIGSSSMNLYDSILCITCTNMTWYRGAKDEDDRSHLHISQKGKSFPNNCSFVLLYDLIEEAPIIDIPLHNRSLAAAVLIGKYLLATDIYGTIHGFDLVSKDDTFRFNGNFYSVSGGFLPLVHCSAKKVLYLNNAPCHSTMGSSGRSGLCLAWKSSFKFTSKRNYFNQTFTAWHIDPKEDNLEYPEMPPSNPFNISHVWSSTGILADHDGIRYKLRFKKSKKDKIKIQSRKSRKIKITNSIFDEQASQVKYLSIEACNCYSYLASFSYKNTVYKAWFWTAAFSYKVSKK